MTEMQAESQLRLQLEALDKKNQALTTALLEARRRLEGLQDQIDRITQPPAQLATFVKAFPAVHEAEVIVGTKPMRLSTGPGFDYGMVSAGQLVRVNDQMIVVSPEGYPREGTIASVLELMGPDRAIVGVDGGGERIAALSGPLRHGALKPGDTVLIDLKTGYAYERVVRSYVEQLLTPEIPDVSYQDIGGLGAQIEQVRDSVELPFKHPELYRDYGLRAPRGILLYGPPGCGKTLIAKAVATSLSDPLAQKKAYFISIKGPELLNKYVGETERHIRSIFARARALASEDNPVVVFFDEMEALFRTRGSGVSSDVETMIVPQLLAEMDGLESMNNVVVIGASNRADMIDPAVLRPGRLDVRVRVSRPDRDQAREIFAKHLNTELPIARSLVERAGSPQAAVAEMIEAGIDLLYSSEPEAIVFELHMVDGSVHHVYLSDLVSGAMIAGGVQRSKKAAIKEQLRSGSGGLTTELVLQGFHEEATESAELAATTSPDEWARIIGIRGGQVASIVPLKGR